MTHEVTRTTIDEVVEPWRAELPNGVFVWGQTPLPWPRTPQEQDYADRLKYEVALADAGDSFMKKLRYALITAEDGWSRHYLWGYRIFSAWNRARGIGIIVDRVEPTLEQHSFDIHTLYQSGILILRLPYGENLAIPKLLKRIARDKDSTWSERRQQLGLKALRQRI
ncbi:hypothetical protein IAD21_05713 [Abditibacteriota bacterium]|nr:hypothetical protein IAD21_05713 [Abditibacteriota bacterium]